MISKIVIIADGKKSNIDSIYQYLIEREYEVLVAYDGLDGFNLARSEGPDLILIEEVLSGFNGYQICSLLKFDIKYEDIMVLILAYDARAKEHQLANNCGAVGVISIPVDLNKLMEKIKSIEMKEK
ncbi:MAG: response regulator [Candidatus Neomarinimicrobiota bacterium]